MGYSIGIDLGGTKIEGMVLGPDVDIASAERIRVPTPAGDGYDAIVAAVASLIDSLRRNAPVETPVGVGMPGSLTAKGLIKNSNTICLNGRDFRGDLQRRCGTDIVFDNDANCFALAESQLGAAVGYPLVFGVIMGTGTGGGIVINGSVRQGPNGIAGEWGHTILFSDHPVRCYCGKFGCVEQFLSGPSVEQNYHRQSGVSGSAREISDKARQGDPAAKSCIDGFLDSFGRALSNVLNVLDPDAVVLGGGLSNIPELYGEGVRQVSRYLFSDRMTTPIMQHRLGDSAGVIGAALLAAIHDAGETP